MKLMCFGQFDSSFLLLIFLQFCVTTVVRAEGGLDKYLTMPLGQRGTAAIKTIEEGERKKNLKRASSAGVHLTVKQFLQGIVEVSKSIFCFILHFSCYVLKRINIRKLKIQ
jgi:hypothetical protein